MALETVILVCMGFCLSMCLLNFVALLAIAHYHKKAEDKQDKIIKYLCVSKLRKRR